VLRLDRMRLPETVIVDFNFAVRDLKRYWDERAEQQILVVDTTPKGQKPRVPVPKYKTLFQVLGLNKDGTVPDRVNPGTVTKLTQDALAGDVDWSEYGY